jgi:hypothetical protein
MARITEKKRIDIDASCVESPVFLNWMGTEAQREYWLFHYVQSKQIATSEGANFAPFIEDNTNAVSYLNEISRGAIESLICGGNVPISKIEGIKTMLYSPNVLMLMNPSTWKVDGVKWLKVRIAPGTFKLYDTDQKRADIQFTLEFPEINIQSM